MHYEKILAFITYIGLIFYTLNAAYFDHRLKVNGIETTAIIKNVHNYKVKNQDEAKVTVQFTDRLNKTYVTKMTTHNSYSPDSTIQIIYDKNKPQVADIVGNRYYKDELTILFWGVMLITIALCIFRPQL